MESNFRETQQDQSRKSFFFLSFCFLFWAAAICNGATCKWRRPWPQDQPKKNKKQNEINGHMKRISIGLWKKKGIWPRYAIRHRRQQSIHSLEPPHIGISNRHAIAIHQKKKKHFDRIKIKPISTDRNSGQWWSKKREKSSKIQQKTVGVTWWKPLENETVFF